MAKNKTPGDSRRAGAVRARSQIKNPITGTWTKRDGKSGKFMDVKADPKPFKGLRTARARSTASMHRTAKRFSGVLKRLADR